MYPIYTKPVLRPLVYTCQKHWGQTKILGENGVNNCHACYYQLRQLHTVSRSLTSTATLCVRLLLPGWTLYIGLPATRLNCLDRVLRSSVCLIGRVSRFDHISAYIRDVLH